MSLFPDLDLPPGTQINRWMGPECAAALLQDLNVAIPWEDHVVPMYGRQVQIPRMTAWYGPTPYAYSGITHPAQPLTETLDDLLRDIRLHTGWELNAVLCNRYANGDDSVSWHSDNDYNIGSTSAVASFSLGATRNFDLRLKYPTIDAEGRSRHPHYRVDLRAGDLFTMPPGFQKDWEHRVPRTTETTGLRINLTFRSIAC